MKFVRSCSVALPLILVTFILINSARTAQAGGYGPPTQSRGTFASGPTDGGRFIINWSPTLASFVGIAIWIDGKLATPLVRGRTYECYLTPGRHKIVASPNRLRGDWIASLDVQPGRTYAFTAYYNTYSLILHPVTESAKAQFVGVPQRAHTRY